MWVRWGDTTPLVRSAAFAAGLRSLLLSIAHFHPHFILPTPEYSWNIPQIVPFHRMAERTR